MDETRLYPLWTLKSWIFKKKKKNLLIFVGKVVTLQRATECYK